MSATVPLHRACIHGLLIMVASRWMLRCGSLQQWQWGRRCDDSQWAGGIWRRFHVGPLVVLWQVGTIA